MSAKTATLRALAAVAWVQGTGPHPQSDAAFAEAAAAGWLVQDPCWTATPAGRSALTSALEATGPLPGNHTDERV